MPETTAAKIKNAEVDMRQQLDMLQGILDSIPAPVFYKDAEGIYLGCNSSFAVILGLPREQIIGKTVFDVAPPELAQVYFDADRELFEHPGQHIYETSVRYADGARHDVIFYKATFSNRDGRVGGLVGTILDITERKITEEILKQHNEYLAALTEMAIGLVSRLDINSIFQTIISRIVALMKTQHGYIYLLDEDTGEIYKHTSIGVFEYFPEARITYGRGVVGKVMQSGSPIAVDNYHVWEDRIPNQARDVLRAIVGLPLKSGDKVVGVVGVAYVNEERKFGEQEIAILNRFAELASVALDNAKLYEAAQQELRERRRVESELRKLSHAVEQSPVSIIITDPKGDIEYVNPKFTLLTGYETEDVRGMNPRILKSGETSGEEYHNLWQTISQGGVWKGEFHNRKKNGDLYWELSTISPIKDATGNITHYIAVNEDVTERKKLEMQLRHAQKMEAVGQLAGGVAHDFSNILTAIIGYASVMELQLDNESLIKSSVEQILASAERGAKLIQGLLAFSRKQINNPRPVQLNDIVHRVEKLLARLIGEDIHLQAELSREELTIIADSIEIEQVIMNLATNSRDAMPDGGTLLIKTELVEFDVPQVSGMKAGRYAVLSVVDNGVGIEEELQRRIFEPFFTTKEVGKGTGLGLAIVYGIINNHNGCITCSSAPGKGTAFNIYLPTTELPSEKLPQPSSIEKQAGGSETVLLAEDAESVRMLLKDALEHEGYKVVDAVDGEEAMAKYLKHQDVRLLILDAVMPKMSGRDVYQKISSMNPDIKVIFNSGYSIETLYRKGLLDKGKEFLSKPFAPGDLLAKVREVLDK